MGRCNCDEARHVIDGSVRRTVCGSAVPLVPKQNWYLAHDCDYIAARNALIPSAEVAADRRMAGQFGGRNSGIWSRYFIEEMDRLWRERGKAALRRQTSAAPFADLPREPLI